MSSFYQGMIAGGILGIFIGALVYATAVLRWFTRGER